MDRYKNLINELRYVLDDNDNYITTLANASAIINENLTDINWVGFYIYNNDYLYLGPFQGLKACTRINLENGVCGKCAREKKVTYVKNVHEFPGHIACDSRSNSELCIPLIINDRLFALLDIDSEKFDRFEENEINYLIEASKIVESKIKMN